MLTHVMRRPDHSHQKSTRSKLTLVQEASERCKSKNECLISVYANDGQGPHQRLITGHENDGKGAHERLITGHANSGKVAQQIRIIQALPRLPIKSSHADSGQIAHQSLQSSHANSGKVAHQRLITGHTNYISTISNRSRKQHFSFDSGSSKQ